MRLAAIYIKEHEYIFDEPVIINFGGQYEYEFEPAGNKVYVKRNENLNFIKGFFDQTNLSSQIELISAIVGKNGTGKSSVLDIIRSFFIRNGYGLPYSEAVAIVEMDNSELPLVLHTDFKSIEYRFSFSELEKSGNFDNLFVELERINKNDFQTIYYSPHFDYKYNLNFDEIDIYDISFDKILEKDLEDLDNKNSSASGWKYSPSQELIFKNSIRQLFFLSSHLVTENQIFKNLFDLPNHGEAKLFFRGHLKKDPWNTPSDFRWILKIIKEKLEKELNKWSKIRVFDKNDKIINQIDVNKYLAKRYLIRDIISVLERQMEKNNSYLSEGKISIEKFKESTLELDAFNSFLLFIRDSKIEINGSKWNAFDYDSMSLLLNTLHEYIDEINKENFVQNDNIQIGPLKVINILKLHRNFLLNLFNYFPKLSSSKKDEALFEESNRIEGFINYIPATKKLSSGENALLNLFSRIYGFINNNLVEESKYLPEKKHYIILLDEADLSFHPSWKKKFIKSIISTLPFFFNGLKKPPSLQIIFTTHDPLTLSDIPQSNVIYLDKNIENVTFINNDKAQSFGANVHDLLANSFFLGDGFIGDFAKEKIQEVLDNLNFIFLSQEIEELNNNLKENNKDLLIFKKEQIKNLEGQFLTKDKEYLKKIIAIVDEPILRYKMDEMYTQAFPEEVDKDETIKRVKRILGNAGLNIKDLNQEI
jgi:predicted ATP-binding protein involved in virulence